jgi:signal transduction histidine kinase
VEDTGYGISKEGLNRLFQKFERLEPDPKVKGSGLGLWICKQIIEAHDGKIWAESELGKGSQFFFILPKEK